MEIEKKQEGNHLLSGIRSQYGQAEFILALYQPVTKSSRKLTVVEVGANQPTQGSNSCCFIVENHKCYLIEANTDYAEQWKRLNIENAEIYNSPIEYSPDGLVNALKSIGIEKSFDILFLDIDGGEYHLLKNNLTYRPSIICVEVDNGFPPNIKYVPPTIQHGMDGGQASSLSTFLMLQSMQYTYVRSFAQDMVFVSNEMVTQILPQLGPQAIVGIDAYYKYAAAAIYNPLPVLLNQNDEKPTAGIDFYRKKIDSLLWVSQPKEAAFLYFMLEPWFQILPNMLANRSESYGRTLLKEVEDFRKSYFHMMLTPILAP